jgi:hypothetical protein
MYEILITQSSTFCNKFRNYNNMQVENILFFLFPYVGISQKVINGQQKSRGIISPKHCSLLGLLFPLYRSTRTTARSKQRAEIITK